MKEISRRCLLYCSALLTALAVTKPVKAALSPLTGGGMNQSKTIFFVPGYRPNRILYQGISLAFHPKFTEGIDDNYRGPRTMVSRFEWGGKVQRKVFPLKGHQITVSSQSPIASLTVSIIQPWFLLTVNLFSWIN